MKATQAFKETVAYYLQGMARTDRSFADKFSSPSKSMDDCITYILNTVKDSGVNGFTDEEVYSMAVHYFMEDGIDPGKPATCRVVVNHTVELSEEEKQELRNKARLQFYSDEMSSRKSKSHKQAVSPAEEEPNLFNIF